MEVKRQEEGPGGITDGQKFTRDFFDLLVSQGGVILQQTSIMTLKHIRLNSFWIFYQNLFSSFPAKLCHP